jgi:hypothetical protein
MSNSNKFYKCMSNDYSRFIKGKIYNEYIIEKYLFLYPNDWKEVSPYPSTKEILLALETKKDAAKIIKTLKQWMSDK